MSHFTRLKTRITNKEMLINCLKEMGYEVRENCTIKGYRYTKHKVDVAVSTKSGYEIGFVMDEEGVYNVVADWWGISSTSENEFARQLEEQFVEVERQVQQAYAVRTALEQLKRQGFDIVRQENREDGTVKLLARRWA